MEKTISSLIHQITKLPAEQTHVVGLSFVEGDQFVWQHDSATIQFDPKDPEVVPLLLHEVGHARLHHTLYGRDIQLLQMERSAWDEARQLAAQLGIAIDDTIVEDSLDSYRDWLHNRSLCPNCAATGIQLDNGGYHCLACSHEWRANEARSCALRRYTIKKRS